MKRFKHLEKVCHKAQGKWNIIFEAKTKTVGEVCKNSVITLTQKCRD